MNTTVGNTKLRKCDFIDNLGNHIYIKDESSNPTGSIKDRTTYQMLLDYKASGKLKDGSTIIEATSGNTGISLCYFQKEFNYKAIIVMPTNVSLERRKMIADYGGELCLVDGGMKECSAKTLELIQNIPNSFIFDQFNCPSNPKAHLKTAQEINEQLENIDYIFVCFGTGGTATGIATYFKNTKTKVIGIEPEESPLVSKGYAAPHKIQGIGANFIPSIFKKDLLSEIITVNGDESITMAKTINASKDFFNGISSGAALLGAIKYIKEHNLKDKNIVVIFPDKGDRYQW